MAFESLADKLSEAFKKLRSKGKLSEADVKLLDNLAERGMDIVFHQLPNASKVTWKAFKETI